MRVLITGGAGFIGSHLAETYLGRGDEVHVVDDLSTGKIENINHFFTNSRFSYTICSVFDSNTMDKLIKNTDIILHLASAVGVQYVLNNPLTLNLPRFDGHGVKVYLNLMEVTRWNKDVIMTDNSSLKQSV